ncbi:MAG: cysteine desulfurase [Chloroflexi bacterium]|nr:cysteine desulfurase [Chloroflexota bacterium]
MNLEKIRKDFPILNEKVNGNNLVYLDNAATSQKPKEVIESLVNYYEKYNSNVHRGVHALSIKATDEFEKSRIKIQKFINAKSSNEIIFTRNASESLNLIAYSWGKANISSGDEIFITPFEHHSNIVPWQMLCKEKGAILKYLPLNNNGDIDIDKFGAEISKKTKLVSVTHMSNVLGTVLPLEEIIDLAKKYNAVTVVDACQSVPHMPVDVQKIDSDFLCFSGHKMLGPTGIGVLHGKEEILDKMIPFLYGGDMISEVTYEESKWNELPYKFEAGTPNIADSIALGVACEYLVKVGMENIWNHEMELGEYTVNQISKLDKFKILGNKSKELRGGVVSFVHETIHPHDIGSLLDGYGIAIRTGHHCAMPLVRSYGVVAASRASFYLYNNKSEVDKLVEGLKLVEDYFK